MLASAEAAQLRQEVLGKPVWFHVIPESAEKYTRPGLGAATSLVPSAEEATAFHAVIGAR